MTHFIRRIAVCERYGISRSTLYAWIKEGTFPRPTRLGPRLVAWPLDLLLAWEKQRPQGGSWRA